ncbi:ATP-binding protein [Candidatus Chlorohelix allophototropha]|uniref:ATP-binding protein n=2 Tax=Candidatus Chlorohelix allophototropha TaxID=3003348 RepID=A0ABY9B501_9CHLR|nr:ATP-binding protein [Chloroflexota bacterium L227-S17]
MFKRVSKIPAEQTIKKYINLFQDSKAEKGAIVAKPSPTSNRGSYEWVLKNNMELSIKGLPDTVPEIIAQNCRELFKTAVGDLLVLGQLQEVNITISTSKFEEKSIFTPPILEEKVASKDKENSKPVPNKPSPSKNRITDEITLEERATQYKARPPLYSFDFLSLPEELKETLLSSIDSIRLDHKIFYEWNLRAIEPNPRTALNFFGPPGTGKTLAAHALAQYLGVPILTASYGQIESKYHGEGPKNVEALFFAAQRDKAVLFIDEADSLLSKRLTEVTQASEQAINAIRGQLMISLELYQGVVIFATNLIKSYDQAFETRVRYIHFPMPDEKSRREIWMKHLPKELPLGQDVSIEELARIEDVCGRDIKNAVIDAAIRTARHNRVFVGQQDLINAVERIKAARVSAIESE